MSELSCNKQNVQECMCCSLRHWVCTYFSLGKLYAYICCCIPGLHLKCLHSQGKLLGTLVIPLVLERYLLSPVRCISTIAISFVLIYFSSTTNPILMVVYRHRNVSFSHSQIICVRTHTYLSTHLCQLHSLALAWKSTALMLFHSRSVQHASSLLTLSWLGSWNAPSNLFLNSLMVITFTKSMAKIATYYRLVLMLATTSRYLGFNHSILSWDVDSKRTKNITNIQAVVPEWDDDEVDVSLSIHSEYCTCPTIVQEILVMSPKAEKAKLSFEDRSQTHRFSMVRPTYFESNIW